jgi:hypothetical protein
MPRAVIGADLTKRIRQSRLVLTRLASADWTVDHSSGGSGGNLGNGVSISAVRFR